jgi:MoaA/NifB/PqqE/SkfB family radical SAM enzyme
LKGESLLPTVGIQFAACQLNKEDIVPMADMAVALGVDYLSYKPVYKNKHNPDHPVNELTYNEAFTLLTEAKKRENKKMKIYTKIDQFHDVLEDGSRTYKKCRSHSVSPYIEEDGSIAFCGNLYPDSVIGNLHEQSLMDIWHGEAHSRAIESIELNKCVQGCKYHRLNMILEKLKHFDPELHLNFI